MDGAHGETMGYWKTAGLAFLGLLCLCAKPGLFALPALGAYWLLRRGPRSRPVAALVVPALLLLLVPNLRWLASWAAFKVKAGATLQEIRQMVEEPESLLIQSEVREDDFVNDSYDDNDPYDWNSRGTVIGKYLNTGRLKALAIQSPGGAAHLFRPGAEPFYAASERCHREWRAMYEFEKRLEEEAEAAIRAGRDGAALKARAEKAGELEWKKMQRCSGIRSADIWAAYNSAAFFESVAELPPMRYRVHVWEKDKPFLLWRLYRLRQLDIYDNQSGERIAWAQTYYRDKWWLTRFIKALDNLVPNPYAGVPVNYVQLRQGPRLRDFAENVLFGETDRRKQAE